MITDERVEKSIIYMAESDEPFAYARAKAKAIEKEEKIVKAQAFINAKRLYDTIAEANAVAESSKEYKNWEDDKTSKAFDYMILKVKRDTEKLIWETWRTEQANLRNI